MGARRSQKPPKEDRFSRQYLDDTARLAGHIEADTIEALARALLSIRTRGGRVFFLGVGGSAANASHAANDFRKLASFEAYAPTDNIAELTARANDDGFDTIFATWLAGSRLCVNDGVFVLSVGGGSLAPPISVSLIHALTHARSVGATIIGIVGRDGGETAKMADVCLVVPTVNTALVTPHTEAFQSVILHLLVSHPSLQTVQAKWESVR